MAYIREICAVLLILVSFLPQKFQLEFFLLLPLHLFELSARVRLRLADLYEFGISYALLLLLQSVFLCSLGWNSCRLADQVSVYHQLESLHICEVAAYSHSKMTRKANLIVVSFSSFVLTRARITVFH